MLSYCLKCRKNTDSKNSKLVRTRNQRITFLSKVCDIEKLRFIKEQKAIGLLSSLAINTPLIKIPLLGPLLSLKVLTS